MESTRDPVLPDEGEGGEERIVEDERGEVDEKTGAPGDGDVQEESWERYEDERSENIAHDGCCEKGRVLHRSQEGEWEGESGRGKGKGKGKGERG